MDCKPTNRCLRNLFALLMTVLAPSVLAVDFYSFSAVDIEGDVVTLEKYRGKVSLVVNVASDCGFTARHYEGLVKIQDILGKTGKFTVLAFPCNQFGAQEPDGNDQIFKWAKDTFQVNFPMFSKINVIEEGVPPMWRYLKEQSGLVPNWNFWKYLVDIDGHFLKAWGPWSDVEEITPAIAQAIKNMEAHGPPRVQDLNNTPESQHEGGIPPPPPKLTQPKSEGPPRRPGNTDKSLSDKDGPGMPSQKEKIEDEL